MGLKRLKNKCQPTLLNIRISHRKTLTSSNLSEEGLNQRDPKVLRNPVINSSLRRLNQKKFQKRKAKSIHLNQKTRFFPLKKIHFQNQIKHFWKKRNQRIQRPAKKRNGKRIRFGFGYWLVFSLGSCLGFFGSGLKRQRFLLNYR